jgi:hypothetical protein
MVINPIVVNGKIYNKLVNDAIINPNNHCTATKNQKINY